MLLMNYKFLKLRNISYKHSDISVAPLNIPTTAITPLNIPTTAITPLNIPTTAITPLNIPTTARAYVDKIIELFEEDEIYKGEGNEDLSDFKDVTIATHLKNKIYDSSITLVLISPNMKDTGKKESDQWIPWEISYSLKEISRGGRTSRTNGILAIVLPDQSYSYSYFLQENSCPYCHYTTFHTDKLFQILRDNMFNIKKPTFNNCFNHTTNPVYLGLSSYISSVKWCDFIGNKENYLQIAEDIRDKIDDYNIKKIVEN